MISDINSIINILLLGFMFIIEGIEENKLKYKKFGWIMISVGAILNSLMLLKVI